MIVKAIYKDKNFNYFRDVETNDKRVYGDVFECDDALAEKRIEKGLVKRASKKEEKEYLEQLEKSAESEEQKPVIPEKDGDENKELTSENNDENEKGENEDKDLTSDLESGNVPPELPGQEDTDKNEQ